MIEARAKTVSRESLSVWVTIAGAAFAGALVGVIAQLLRQFSEGDDSFIDLGRSTAV